MGSQRVAFRLLISLITIWESSAITNNGRSYPADSPVRNFRHIGTPSSFTHTDWELGLREATNQALLRERYHAPNLRERLLAAPLVGKRDSATPFGDIAILARGKLYVNTGSDFAFVQDPNRNDCEACHNARRRCASNRCDEEGFELHGSERLVALWTVKRLRHRDYDHDYRYETEYTISPVSVPITEMFDEGHAHVGYSAPGHVFVIKHDADAPNTLPAPPPTVVYNRRVPHHRYRPEVLIGVGPDGRKHFLRSYPGFYTSFPVHPTYGSTNDPKEIELYRALIEALAEKTSTTQKGEDGPHRFSLNHYGDVSGSGPTGDFTTESNYDTFYSPQTPLVQLTTGEVVPLTTITSPVTELTRMTKVPIRFPSTSPSKATKPTVLQMVPTSAAGSQGGDTPEHNQEVTQPITTFHYFAPTGDEDLVTPDEVEEMKKVTMTMQKVEDGTDFLFPSFEKTTAASKTTKKYHKPTTKVTKPSTEGSFLFPEQTPVPTRTSKVYHATFSAAKAKSLSEISKSTSLTTTMRQNTPTAAEATSATSETISSSQISVATLQTTPSTSKITPTTSKATPTTSKATPITSRTTPTTSKAAPTTSKAAPTTSKAAPTTSKAAPTTSKAASTSKVTPTTSKTTPTTSKVTPTTSKVTPTTSKTTPTTKATVTTSKTTYTTSIAASIRPKSTSTISTSTASITYTPFIPQFTSTKTASTVVTSVTIPQAPSSITIRTTPIMAAYPTPTTKLPTTTDIPSAESKLTTIIAQSTDATSIQVTMEAEDDHTTSSIITTLPTTQSTTEYETTKFTSGIFNTLEPTTKLEPKKTTAQSTTLQEGATDDFDYEVSPEFVPTKPMKTMTLAPESMTTNQLQPPMNNTDTTVPYSTTASIKTTERVQTTDQTATVPDLTTVKTVVPSTMITTEELEMNNAVSAKQNDTSTTPMTTEQTKSATDIFSGTTPKITTMRVASTSPGTKPIPSSTESPTLDDFFMENEKMERPVHVKLDYGEDDIFGSTKVAVVPTTAITRKITESDFAGVLFGNRRRSPKQYTTEGSAEKSTKIIFGNFYEASTSPTSETTKNEEHEVDETTSPLPSLTYMTSISFKVDKRNRTNPIENNEAEIPIPNDTINIGDSTEVTSVTSETTTDSTKKAFDEAALQLVNHVRSINYLNRGSNSTSRLKYKRKRTYVPKSRKRNFKRKQ